MNSRCRQTEETACANGMATLARGRTAALLLGVLAWIGLMHQTAGTPVAREYQLKAAFLLNFTKFVEWPAGKFTGSQSPIVIGVWGGDPFGGDLRATVKGRTVNGRPVEIMNVRTPAEMSVVHVLFVPAAESGRLKEAAAVLARGHVLTVGETPEALEAGAMITFVLEADRLRFDIRTGPAERAGLRISAHLQKLARSSR